MAPKAANNNNASTVLSDALSSFSRAAHQALATVEEKAKADAHRADAEVEGARRERDEALQTLHECQLQVKDCERRADAWKTSVEKSELTIQHQGETIAQLRAESQQWKDQLLRLEETLRQEIRDWKEQYQRAEQERLRLSGRLDAFISEQLQRSTEPVQEHASYPSTYLSGTNAETPKSYKVPYANGTRSKNPAKLITTTDRERTAVDALQPPLLSKKGPTPTTSVTRTPKQKAVIATASSQKKASASVPRASTSQRPQREDSRAESQPQQVLIRRVHAVVEVPVKEEPTSDDDFASGSETQSLDSDYEPAQKAKTTPRRQARRSSVKSRPIIESDEDEDEDEETDADELLLVGPEPNYDESYNQQPVAKTPEPKRPRQTAASATTKKRKLNDNSAATSRKPKAAKNR